MTVNLQNVAGNRNPVVMDDDRRRLKQDVSQPVGAAFFAYFLCRNKESKLKRSIDKSYELALRNCSMNSARAAAPSIGIAL